MADTKIDFDRLANALLDRAKALVPEWLPGGRQQGQEWVCGDLGGGKGRSVSVNLNTGKWADFAFEGEAGNDLVSLYASIHGLNQGKAGRELIEDHGFAHCLLPADAVQTPAPAARAPRAPVPAPAPAAGKGRRESAWEPVVPVPANAPRADFRHFHYADPDAVWEYRFNGQLYGYIVRFRNSEGGKEIMPRTWCRDTNDAAGTMKWHWMQWREPRPLYVPAGQLSPLELGRPVLLVEGEKCAQAGHELLGEEFDWVSWSGGSKAWAKAEWAWLKGRHVLLWEDGDAKRERLTADEKRAGIDPATKPLLPLNKQPGHVAMQSIGELLQAQQGCKVERLRMPAVGHRPEGWKGEFLDGWDVADLIEQGWDADRVRAFAAGREAFIGASPEQRAAAASVPADPPAGAGRDEAAPASGSAGWRAKLISADGKVSKVRDNLVLALDGMPMGEGRARLAGIPEVSGLIAYNQFSNNVIKLKAAPWGTPAGEWLEHDELEMGNWLTREHMLPSMPRATLEEAVQMVSRRHAYHPVRARLDTLRGTWDGTRRMGSWLRRLVCGPAPESMSERERQLEDAYLSRVGAWLLMGMCARVLTPGCKFDYMVILEGGQGVGKSTLARTLGGEWFADTGLTLGDKDSFQNLQGIWVYEWGELDSLNKSEVTKVKQFVSSQKDRFRASFDRRARDYPRQCVFIGTTNEDAYLTDPTGNRRMWPVRVGGRVNVDGLRAELDQLMAEALTEVEKGTRFHPTPSEQEQLFNPQQMQRTVEPAIEASIIDHLYNPQQRVNQFETPGTSINEISLVKLLERIGIGLEKLNAGRFHEKQAAAALRKLGWTEVRSSAPGRPRVYRRPKELPACLAGLTQSPTQGTSDGSHDAAY